MSAGSLPGSRILRQIFRPGVLSIMALAVAVGGWAYGYKLSQYVRHSGVTKASATRMWVEHRASTAPHLLRSQKLPSSGIPATLRRPLPCFPVERFLTSSLPFARAARMSPQHSLRAPPASPSLA